MCNLPSYSWDRDLKNLASEKSPSEIESFFVGLIWVVALSGCLYIWIRVAVYILNGGR